MTTPHKPDPPRYAVPALEKTLDILEYLSAQAVPMTQAQLARALGRQPSELFRILAYLEQRGYLYRDPASAAYSLTLKLFELSRQHSPYDALLQVARPLMQRLTKDIREPCHLSVLHHDKLLVLAQSESPDPFRLSVQIGSLHSPVNTVSGRVLLAHMPSAALDVFLKNQPDYLLMSVAQRQAFHDCLALVRERGFDNSDGERFVGWLDLGVLVGTPASRTQAALTLAALKQPDAPNNLLHALPQLNQCAEEITRQVGLGEPAQP